MKPIRTLICTCCGSYTKGRQYFNLDHGYGLCVKCGDWMAERHRTKPMVEPESPEKIAGQRGVYWDIQTNEPQLAPGPLSATSEPLAAVNCSEYITI